jgi:hypothetical protein
MKTPTPAYTHPTRRQRTALASQSIWTTAFMQQSTVHNDTRSRHAVQHTVLQPRSSQPTASNPPANKQHTLHSFASQPTSTMDPFNTTGPRHTLASIWQHAPVASKPSCPAPDCPARNSKSIQGCSGCSSGSSSRQTGSQSLPLLPLPPATTSSALRACTALTIPIPAVPITHGPVVCDCLGPKPLSKVLPVLSIS